MNLVSVVLPVHNGALFLQPAIDSILTQTHQHLELIVVDNGSTDRSAEIAALSAHRDNRIKLLKLPDKNLCAALRTGLASAKGNHFARMDADDLCHPRRLEKQRDFLNAHPAVQVVTAKTRFLGDKKAAAGFWKYQRWTNRLLTHDTMVKGIWKELPYVSPTLFMRINDLRRAGGFDNIELPDDFHLALRFLSLGYRFHKLPEKLLTWRDHPARASRILPEIRDQRFFKLKAEFFLRIFPHFQSRMVLWGAGKNGKRLARAFAELGHPIKLFLDKNQGRWNQKIQGIVVRPPARPSLEPGDCVIGAVAERGAASELRRKLKAWGLEEGKSFFMFC